MSFVKISGYSRTINPIDISLARAQEAREWLFQRHEKVIAVVYVHEMDLSFSLHCFDRAWFAFMILMGILFGLLSHGLLHYVIAVY